MPRTYGYAAQPTYGHVKTRTYGYAVRRTTHYVAPPVYEPRRYYRQVRAGKPAPGEAPKLRARVDRR